MKATLPLLILLFSAVIQNGFTQQKNLKMEKSKLTEATVFFQGAELTHTASSSLTKGENEISIEGLSPNIDRNSLKVKTSNGVVVSASEFTVDFLSENKSNAIVKKLDDSLTIYRQKLNQLNTDTEITRSLLGLLQKGTEKNVAGSEKGLAIDELKTTIDYYKVKSTELQKTLSANDELKKKYETTISGLQKQIEQESLKNSKTSGVLKLTLSSPVTASCNFTISYYTVAASWAPFYNITVENTDKPIKIQTRSKVRQTTGLDWDKVKLTLSSATPSNGKVAPLFSAWFLDYYNPSIKASRNMAAASQNSYSYGSSFAMFYEKNVPSMVSDIRDESAKDKKQLLPLYIVDGVPVDAAYVASIDADKIKDTQMMDAAEAAKLYGDRGAGGVVLISLKSSMDDYVAEKETDMNLVYAIDIPYSVPGNGKEQTIDLQMKEASAEYKYYCAPKLDIETYLLAEIPNWERLNLLSGKATITYDGTYVGETFIDARSTQKTLSLTLGTDKRVSVKREKLQDYSSTSFLGSDVKQAFAYKMTVRNSQNKPVKMVLKDQYPISSQKNINVELLNKETTPWTANVESLGVITWEGEIGAGETKEYKISYTVKYPKDSKLNL